MTLGQLAEITSLTHGYLSKIENNKHKPKVSTLKVLAETVGIPFIDLLIKSGYLTEEDIKQYKENANTSESNTKFPNIQIGNKIKLIRKELGLNMEDFGKLFTPTASKGVISNWENNYNLPNNERLKRIAELGGIPVNELLKGGEHMELTDEQITKINNLWSMAHDISCDVDGVALSAIEGVLAALGIDHSFLEYVPMEEE